MLRFFAFAARLYLSLLGARRLRLRAGPVSLAYYRLGRADGEPWVLLHGLGAIAVSWSPVLRRLRRDCLLLVPELSSLGGTLAPGPALGIGPGARALGQLLAHEFGDRQATVAGISLGGWMAVRLALLQPERIARLALIDAGGYRRQNWTKIESLVRIDDLRGVDRLYRALFVRAPWVMRVSRAGFLKSYTSEAVRSTLDGLSEGDTYDDDDLARLRMPTALVWGERDGLFSVATARAMAAALPHASLDVIPGCGHAVHIECPRRLTAALQRFRRAVPVAAAGAVRPQPALPGAG
jgi:pimeloyl-ACP methyl ester carboxylesterase